MTNKIAIIDCGTNTFHLLIMEIGVGKQTIVVKEKTVVKIGAGGINDKRIIPEAEERAIKALTDFKEQIDSQQVDKIYAFATSAFRNATNGTALRDKVKQSTGLDINIISGDQEAEYIFKGVSYGLALTNESCLVMDIGGGSVEFIIGEGQDILWKRSYEIGAQRLLDLFHDKDPIDDNSLKKLFAYLDEELPALFEALQQHKPTILIGSSGTFDTLSEIYSKKNHLNIDENPTEIPFSINAFESIYQELVSKNREERLMIPGMIEMRVDMIVVATALIKYIITRHQFDAMRVSTYALKEGVLSEILKKGSKA